VNVTLLPLLYLSALGDDPPEIFLPPLKSFFVNPRVEIFFVHDQHASPPRLSHERPMRPLKFSSPFLLSSFFLFYCISKRLFLDYLHWFGKLILVTSSHARDLQTVCGATRLEFMGIPFFSCDLRLCLPVKWWCVSFDSFLQGTLPISHSFSTW